MNFLQYLNQIVSFNKRDPYQMFNPDFSETPPLNYNFDFMGYGSMNFLDNLGLVAFLCIFVAVRQLVGVLACLLQRTFQSCACLKSKQKVLASTGYISSNMWLRFFLMTYFEFCIACILGANF